ncbi:gluconokinase/xylulokinase [Haloactinopolyspora alba]|uniref:Gluconokinase/xylulokinase n=1 Tax=Haloactinopolyspora alba TaxID=648780 RepID=A0A2P8EF17_9ACTN|nr:FGGY family carbohydrate kinase [Haloactinopolyspora alba]PSL08056.1 gluconokinase/xylulokinase [Haloactinopolyspora alba]
MTASTATGPLVLSVDVGTSAVKAGVYTTDGARVAGSSAALTATSPRRGHWTMDAGQVESALVAAVREVAAAVPARRVAAMGVSTAAPTPLVVDGEGRPLSEVCTFSDARAAGTVRQLVADGAGPGFLRRTGNRLAVATTSALTATALWDAADRPAGARFGHLASLVTHRLTGRWVMDPTHAAFTGLTDMHTSGTWSETAIADLGVPPELLPELLSSSEAAGPLTPAAAERLGLPAGIPVTVGAADTACAALGVGCVEHGRTFESVGTSGVLTICRDHPVPMEGAMNRPHAVPGRWLSHWAMSSSGGSLRWLAETGVGSTAGHDPADLAALTELAAAAPPGSDGVLFLPYLCGERSPVWDADARGAWAGLGLGTGPAHLVRSVLESTGYALRQFMELERKESGLEVTEVASVGGGSASATWSQIKADVTGRTFRRVPDGNAACRGASLLACSAAGLVDDLASAAERRSPELSTPVRPTPDAAARETYDRMFEAYLSLYPALRDVDAMLTTAAEGGPT